MKGRVRGKGCSGTLTAKKDIIYDANKIMEVLCFICSDWGDEIVVFRMISYLAWESILSVGAILSMS